ncbi:hypothetical protein FACS1894184_08730 [Clostridia bacterium]|nr:hypothetical protein FACS1894184_08730 [Clostridia bacterium]
MPGPQGLQGPKGNPGKPGTSGSNSGCGIDYCELETRIMLTLTRYGYSPTQANQQPTTRRGFDCGCGMNDFGYNNFKPHKPWQYKYTEGRGENLSFLLN